MKYIIRLVDIVAVFAMVFGSTYYGFGQIWLWPLEEPLNTWWFRAEMFALAYVLVRLWLIALPSERQLVIVVVFTAATCLFLCNSAIQMWKQYHPSLPALGVLGLIILFWTSLILGGFAAVVSGFAFYGNSKRKTVT